MTYYVLIENGKQGGYTATALSLPGFIAHGATRQEALTRLRQSILTRLAEIVPLEIEHPDLTHPWLPFAGMFKDDPLFDDVLAAVEAYRRDLDANGDVL